MFVCPIPTHKNRPLPVLRTGADGILNLLLLIWAPRLKAGAFGPALSHRYLC
jgi:hypothetical protein